MEGTSPEKETSPEIVTVSIKIGNAYLQSAGWQKAGGSYWHPAIHSGPGAAIPEGKAVKISEQFLDAFFELWPNPPRFNEAWTKIERPTGDQCSENTRIKCADGVERVAAWYPQMGGYVGACLIELGAAKCFEVMVWHDGEFPFDDRQPGTLHHCSAEQFIEFGELVKNLKGDPK